MPSSGSVIIPALSKSIWAWDGILAYRLISTHWRHEVDMGIYWDGDGAIRTAQVPVEVAEIEDLSECAKTVVAEEEMGPEERNK
jgi:hypothetical protein